MKISGNLECLETVPILQAGSEKYLSDILGDHSFL